MKKAMSLQLFLRLIFIWDDSNNNNVAGETHATELAEKLAQFLGVSRAFVY